MLVRRESAASRGEESPLLTQGAARGSLGRGLGERGVETGKGLVSTTVVRPRHKDEGLRIEERRGETVMRSG